MKAVMYHYVNDGGSRPPFGYYHLDVEDFRAQLDYFEAEFGFVSREQFLDAVETGVPPADGGVVLTFDDGLADHYDFVLPELRSRGLWGIFYVSAGPYLDGGALDVHRVHSLLGAHGGERVADALEARIDDSMVDDEYVETFGDAVYRPQDNETATERAKRLVNYYVDERYKSSVLDDVEADLFDDVEADLPDGAYHDDLYMSRDELRELADAGMLVGSHAVTHQVVSTLSVDDQRREIRDSFSFLENCLGERPVRTYCHPYGGSHSYTDDTLALLEEADCLFSFDVDARDVTRDDLESRPHRLPRYDCNDFRHGDATADLG